MQIGMGMFISQALITSSGYEAEAAALFARFATDPGTTRKNAINTCIASLKSAGVWAKLEALWVFAAHEDSSARLNWVSSSHGISKVGSPTFTVDQGFTGDNTTNYLITSDTLSTYTLYTQNSAHISSWTRADFQDSVGFPTLETGNGVNIFPRFGDGNCYVRVNDNPESTFIAAPGTAIGFILGNRSGATSRQAYKNGVSLGTYGSVSSQAVPATKLVFFAGSTSPQVSVSSVGASLDSTEQLAFYNAINTLKTAIGW